MRKYFDDNAAYDLSKFEETPKKQATPMKLVKPAPKRTVLGMAPAKILCGTLAIMAVTFAFILGKVQLTELNAAVSQANKNLETLQSETTRLDMELESMISLKNVEELAASMGLSRVESYQVEYISLAQGDKVVVADKTQKESFWDSIGNSVNKILSYIRFW